MGSLPMKNSGAPESSRGGRGSSIPELRRRTSSFHKRLRQWLSDSSNLFFALLIVLHLLPIWSFKYFPSQDGPAHINNANILREYHRPDYPIFREYYVLNKNFEPNLFGHLVLAGLMSFLPMLVAEKILLSGYVILLPISIRYVLRTIRPDAGFLAVLAFPFVYNYTFHMGFYNFSCGLVMYFFVVGYWLKYCEGLTLRRTMVLAILALVLYSCHPLPLVTAYVMVTLFTAWLMFLDLAQQIRQRQFNFRVLCSALWRRTLAPLCAFLPTFVLTATFLLQKGTASRVGRFYSIILDRAERLYHLNSLISYDAWEGWFSTALVWLFVAVLIYLLVLQVACHKRNHWDGLLLVVAGYVVIYFIAPDSMSQGGFITARMNLYPFLALILWFGAQSYQRLVKRGIQVAAIGIALAFLGLHMQKYAELNDYLTEFLSGSHLIESNTTLLPFIFSPRGRAPDGRVLSLRIAPFAHASGYIAAQRHLVDLQNYEACTTYFPVMYRSHLNPCTHIYNLKAGSRVDYVLIWRTGEEPFNRFIFQQLEENYELIYTSQRGLMQLYRQKGWKSERVYLQ
jgi:hypothetical protein